MNSFPNQWPFIHQSIVYECFLPGTNHRWVKGMQKLFKGRVTTYFQGEGEIIKKKSNNALTDFILQSLYQEQVDHLQLNLAQSILGEGDLGFHIKNHLIVQKEIMI